MQRRQLLALGLLTLTPRGALAQPGAGWVGRFRYAGGDRQRQGAIDAVDRVVNEVDALRRAMVRGRLIEAVEPYPTLEISRRARSVSVSAGGTTITAPLGGGTAEVTTPHGLTVDASFREAGDTLIMRLAGVQGDRISRFTPTEDGLRVATSITSALLPGAITYRLSYRR